MDWLDFLAVQGTLKSLLRANLKALWSGVTLLTFFFGVAMLRGMLNLSCPNKDQTRVPCSGSTES